MLQEALHKAKGKCVNDLNGLWQEQDDELLRAVEAALFMIGADISAG